MPEGQEVTILQAEYFTQEELDRAIGGVQEFKGTLNKCDSASKKLLLSSDAGEQLQGMFLGIKPMSFLLPSYVEQVKRLPLPDRFKYVGDHIYDSTVAEAVIKENPDVFPDFENSTIDKYMENLLGNGNPAASTNSPDQMAKIGILYGFPKKAVIEYAKYFPEYYRELVDWAVSLAPAAIRDGSWGEIARETLLHYANIDSKGRYVSDPNYLGSFLDKNEAEVREYLKGLVPGWSEDVYDYCLKIRGQQIKAFHFGIRRDLPEAVTFRKRVEGLYDASGMNKALADAKRAPIWQRLFRKS